MAKSRRSAWCDYSQFEEFGSHAGATGNRLALDAADIVREAIIRGSAAGKSTTNPHAGAAESGHSEIRPISGPTSS